MKLGILTLSQLTLRSFDQLKQKLIDFYLMQIAYFLLLVLQYLLGLLPLPSKENTALTAEVVMIKFLS